MYFRTTVLTAHLCPFFRYKTDLVALHRQAEVRKALEHTPAMATAAAKQYLSYLTDSLSKEAMRVELTGSTLKHTVAHLRYVCGFLSLVALAWLPCTCLQTVSLALAIVA